MPVVVYKCLFEMRRHFLKSSFLLIFLWAFLPVSPLFADNGPLIRVAVARDVEQVTVKINGAYEISNPLTRQVLEKDLSFGPAVVMKKAQGLRLGDRELSLNRVRFYASRDVGVIVNSKERRYRGFVDILLTANGKLLVVNHLEIEDYVKGVLAHEVSNRWPMETLKSQAVATRSYAYVQIAANIKKDFDVTDDIYSQVYGGRTSERYRTGLAVDQTKGEILTFEGKVLPAYFHATCGGHTENSSELWPKQISPPLRGVRCIYCQASPHYFWKRNASLRDIRSELIARGYSIGLIEDISITKRNESERILSLVITDRAGKQIEVSGKDFREIVGPNFIRSNNYFIVMKGYYCDFLGKGWGHGVGMCQWGAREMAAQGMTYKRILEFYYPKAVISIVKESPLTTSR